MISATEMWVIAILGSAFAIVTAVMAFMLVYESISSRVHAAEDNELQAIKDHLVDEHKSSHLTLKLVK